MPPSPTWIQGKANITVFAGKYFWGNNPAGQWRLVATHANGEPAFAFYERIGTSGRYRAFSIQVLEIREGKIARQITYMNPALFSFFDLPEEIEV
jgi:RNA polymerase sigma-70 factor, ECF subfamily